MRYTPIFVPVILVFLVMASSLRFPMGVDPAATGAAACDAKQSDCRFFGDLDAALRDVKTIRVFKFPEPCRKCHEANLSQQDFSDLPPTVSLSADDAKYFMSKFGSHDVYITGVQKAMPFFADYGFLLEGSGGRNILLVSTFSKSVRLLTNNPERVLIANIDPLFPDMNTWMARLFGDKGR